MSVVLSVATAAKGFTSVTMILPSIGFHAVTALAGLQLVALGNRKKQAKLAAEAA